MRLQPLRILADAWRFPAEMYLRRLESNQIVVVAEVWIRGQVVRDWGGGR
jgi:hypothetical protein